MLTICFDCFAKSTGVSRMWEVSGKNKDGKTLHFYLLGVTHNGLDIEYDDYFFKSVLPVFHQAGFFSHEAADWNASQAPACREPMPATENNLKMIAKARERVMRLRLEALHSMPKATFPLVDKDEQDEINSVIDFSYASLAKSEADAYSELGLIWAMRHFFYDRAILEGRSAGARKTDAVPDSSPGVRCSIFSGDQVVDSLMRCRPSMEIRSIDSTQDIVDAYCSIPGTARANMFQRNLNEWEYASQERLPEVLKMRHEGETGLVQSLLQGKIMPPFLSDIDDYSAWVCTRNEKWLEKMLSAQDGKTGFYALGIAHLLPRSDGQAPCADLLTMLRNRDMSVRLVH